MNRPIVHYYYGRAVLSILPGFGHAAGGHAKVALMWALLVAVCYLIHPLLGLTTHGFCVYDSGR